MMDFCAERPTVFVLLEPRPRMHCWPDILQTLPGDAVSLKANVCAGWATYWPDFVKSRLKASNKYQTISDPFIMNRKRAITSLFYDH